jgi:Protein of unknown function (DUF3014)
MGMSGASKVGIAVVVALALAGAGAWFLLDRAPPPPPPGPSPAAAPAAPAGPKHPLPEAAQPGAAPLPALDASDPALREGLASLMGAQAVERFLQIDGVVRRIVATVDNLPREEYAARLNPVKPIPGTPVTAGQGEALTLAPANAARYAPFLAMVQAVDTPKLVALYARHYPLFQQAYVELGYPHGHFNDRLVEVIDHLLAAPEAPEPIRLAQPHVLYEYADADLESLSAGDKAMLRIGRDNAARVKAKLREIRALVAASPPAAN